MSSKKNSNVRDAQSYEVTLSTLGKKLTALRVKMGYKSQSDFALEFDLPHIQYWRMERGMANITFKSLDRILQIHGLTITEFFYMLHKENRKPRASDVTDDVEEDNL